MAIEHKEIEGIKKVKGFRDLEEYQGLSISPKDRVIHLFDGAPSSVEIGNAGKDVTVIVN